MTRNKLLLLLFLILGNTGLICAQTFERHLQWKAADEGSQNNFPIGSGFYFENCIPDQENSLPLFFERFALEGNFQHYEAKISNKVFIPLSPEEKDLFPLTYNVDTSIVLNQILVYTRKKPFMDLTFLPFRINALTGEIEKLVSFRITFTGTGTKALKSSQTYAENSVLAHGDWFKIKINERGVHKITYEELTAAGLQMQGINPGKIRLFGNGGAMLPEQNDLPRVDDLREVAISVVSSNPGTFSPGDYLLFFAPSPHTWTPVIAADNLRFEFSKNIYSDFAFYFLTISDAPGKRIQNLSQTNEIATHQVSTFHDYAVYKPDLVSLAHTGRQWFADKIQGASGPYSLPAFHFPDIDLSHRVHARGRFALKANETSRIKLYFNEHEFVGPPVAKPSSYWFANTSAISTTFFANDPVINAAVEYLSLNSTAEAWVDFVEINLKRHLAYSGGQLAFRELSSVGQQNISHFVLSSPFENPQIWDVSAIDDPKIVELSINGNYLEFRLSTPTLREFVAFTSDDFFQVHDIEPVANQNLHGLEPHDMIIVSPEVFMNEAEQYAQLRRETSDLSIAVVQLEETFNEFASGSPDPTAIRDFMKMLYDRADGNEPRYLLLFGDGSYDPKNRVPGNNNFIPTFQSVESLKLDATFISDDYYGLLDDGEGQQANGSLDIGIGRFPVNNAAQASAIYRKTEHYLKNRPETSGSWQNVITVVAHDEDYDLHLIQAEEITDYIKNNHTVFSIDKIYLDAYQRIQIPGGYRYPNVNAAINQRVQDGALLINYIGHGGETGWAYSKVLTNSDINSWKNLNNMPVFITATCSFGRFDNPELVSAGELLVLNPNGGGIALYTTSRLAYSAFNHRLNKSLTRFFLERNENGTATLGSTMMKAKNDNGNNYFIRNFVLLGDPSIKPAMPEFKVITTQLNGQPVNEEKILMGMTTASISGEIQDRNGNKANSFNGIIYPVVYDKAVTYYTNANHPSSTPRPFRLQNTVLYKGKVTVTDGEFSFSFVVPRDVKPSIGRGKISYFSCNEETDAHGFFDHFLIGGYNITSNDDTGPQIELFINTPDFRFGDYTNENPLMIAHLNDTSGINFFGLGLGRDIVAFLNEDTQNPILLNSYFEPNLDSHTSGMIRYQFNDLPEGRHSLRLKAFDLNNNSSTAFTEFVVSSYIALATGKLKNYPNPFSDETTFSFHHNHYNQAVTVTINIFNLHGRQVTSIGPREVFSQGSMAEPIRWNGSDHNGRLLKAGVYIYRLDIQTPDGSDSILQGKLMIIR